MRESFFKENQVEEQDLENLLNTLPVELKKRITEETDDMDLAEALRHVSDFIEKRNHAKDRIFTHIHEIKNPEIQAEVLAVAQQIENNFGNSDYFLGGGTVGKVYRTPYAPHVCVKYIFDTNMQVRHGNTMRDEIGYLEDLDGFTVEGVKVPQVYFDHISDKVTCFGMETIEGLSLDQIIDNPEACDFINELRTQNQQEVLRRMKMFIEKLHKEKNIVHRDLATRNIMVDKKGGWYVIDFGKAKRIELGDTTTDMSEATDFPTAENAIRKLFTAIS